MQHSPSQPFRTLVTLVALCISWHAATATNIFAPVYNFNNGTIDDSKKCQSDEWSRIQTAMGNALGSGSRRELLRSSALNRRNLSAKCSSCGGRPLCLATVGIGCALLGKRRLSEQHDERGLNTSPCFTKMTAVDSALNTIKSTVSAPCQALLNAPCNIQCAEYTKDCDIIGFTVVSVLTQKVVTKLNTTGTRTSFCSSAGYITIRAETNFFLGNVTFTFSGPSVTETVVEADMPYVAFGKEYIIQNPLTALMSRPYVPKPKFNGRFLFAGVYTVSAFSQDDPASGQNATFTVKNC